MKLNIKSETKRKEGVWVGFGDAEFLIRPATDNEAFERETLLLVESQHEGREKIERGLADARKAGSHRLVAEGNARLIALERAVLPEVVSRSVLVGWKIEHVKGQEEAESAFLCSLLKNHGIETPAKVGIPYSEEVALELLTSGLTITEKEAVDGKITDIEISFMEWVSRQADTSKNFHQEAFEKWDFLDESSAEESGGAY